MRLPGRPSAWAWVASWAGSGLVLLAAQLRILTYLTGQDPFTYVRLGLELLQNGLSLEALRKVAAFIVPGYPLFLAMVVRGFGPYAPAWVGFFWLWGALTGLLLLGRKWGLGPWGGLLMATTLLWLLWRGDPLHAHYLLYAFRGGPQFFVVVWAVVLVESADPVRPRGGLRLSLATGVLIAGALIRETSLMALPGLLAWAALAPAWAKHRGRAVLCLLAPVAIVLAGGLAYALAVGRGTNEQAVVWWSYLRHLDAASYGRRLLGCFRSIGDSAGWIGSLLFALGLWLQRRKPFRLALWLVPALGLACFYAVFMVHRRYALDSFLLLAVVAAAGLAAGIVEAGRCMRPRLRAAWLAGSLVVMLGLNLQVVRKLPPWQQKVSRDQVEHLATATHRHETDPGRIWADWNCPFLIEAAWTFLGGDPLSKWERFPSGLDSQGWCYWRAAGAAAFSGVRCEDLIRRHADLRPLVDETGAAEEATLGSLRYTLHRVTPWTERRVEQEWSPAPNGPPLLWLDFQASDPDAQRQVRLLAADGAERQRWALPRGNGLIPLFVTAAPPAADSAFRLVVESSNVLPAELLRRPEIRDGWANFTMVQGRWPSALEWILPPASRSAPREKWGATFADAAVFDCPVPAGMPGGELLWAFTLEPRYRHGEEVVFHYAIAEQPVLTVADRLNRPRLVHEIRMKPPQGSSRAKIELRIDLPPGFQNHFRLVSMGCRTE